VPNSNAITFLLMHEALRATHTRMHVQLVLATCIPNTMNRVPKGMRSLFALMGLW
jgi:hypothetical protein